VDMSLAFATDFDVQVVCLDEPGKWAPVLRERGIEVNCVWRQPGMDLSVPRKLAQQFRRRDVDIIHAHQCTPWFYAALSRLLHSRPRLLLEEHGRFYPELKNRKRALVNRWLIRRLTHAFVAVSQDIRQRLEAYEGLDAREIDVVYNGITAPAALAAEDRIALRASFGIRPDDFVVGTVGRFDSIKNLPMLVKALAEVGSIDPAVRGLLVGDGPVMASIKSLVASTAMADRIHLAGYRSDAGNLTQCMDLFVLSSLSEGTSMALLEAMAAGVPCAVTAVGGNPEIVLGGSTGWTVPSDDSAALALVMRSAVAADGPRRGYAQGGKSRYIEHFTARRMIEAYRAQYQRLLESVPGRRDVP